MRFRPFEHVLLKIDPVLLDIDHALLNIDHAIPLCGNDTVLTLCVTPIIAILTPFSGISGRCGMRLV
jgi:hypothetical protein